MISTGLKPGEFNKNEGIGSEEEVNKNALKNATLFGQNV